MQSWMSFLWLGNWTFHSLAFNSHNGFTVHKLTLYQVLCLSYSDELCLAKLWHMIFLNMCFYYNTYTWLHSCIVAHYLLHNPGLKNSNSRKTLVIYIQSNCVLVENKLTLFAISGISGILSNIYGKEWFLNYRSCSTFSSQHLLLEFASARGS